MSWESENLSSKTAYRANFFMSSSNLPKESLGGNQTSHSFLFSIGNSRHLLHREQAKLWVPKEIGTKYLTTKNRTNNYFSSLSNNSSRKKKKKKIRGVRKRNSDVEKDSNLLLNFSGQDVFLSKAS